MLLGFLGSSSRRSADRSAVGVDVGARSAKLVQVAAGPAAGGRPRVVAAASLPRAGEGPVTAAEAAGWVAALSGNGFAGRRAVLAAPAESAMVGPIELPPRSSNAPLDQLARMEIARNFRCPPDSFELAWWELPAGARGGRGVQGLAVGLPHAKADALLDAVEPAGLSVDAIDAAPAALARACGPALSEDGITAVLDLSWGPACLSFVYRGVVTFSRRLPEGAIGPVHRAVCEKLTVEADVAEYLLGEAGLTGAAPSAADGEPPLELPEEGRRLVIAFADALCKELSLSFSYATHQYPDAAVSKLLLVGGGASIAGLAARMGEALGVDAAAVAPADLAECPPALLVACASPAMTLALGLAMREVTP